MGVRLQARLFSTKQLRNHYKIHQIHLCWVAGAFFNKKAKEIIIKRNNSIGVRLQAHLFKPKT